MKSHRFHNAEGCPEGGHTFGTGFAIAWQRGPLQPSEHPFCGEPPGKNGAFVEDIITAAMDRLSFFQESRFKCLENEEALAYLRLALQALGARTKRRVVAGTEGSYRVD